MHESGPEVNKEIDEACINEFGYSTFTLAEFKTNLHLLLLVMDSVKSGRYRPGLKDKVDESQALLKRRMTGVRLLPPNTPTHLRKRR